jgi:Resolvase, N terminal domain
MKRAALYLRDSTVDQHPESQLYDLRQLVAQRGYEIVEEYTDKISGAKAKRPGLDRLMTDARHGRFQVVVVWAFDRMARSVRHFLEVLDELNHLQIEFVSFRENIDTGGPLGRAMVVIVSAIAELERNLIVDWHRGRVTPPPLPHHRTCGSAYGGSADKSYNRAIIGGRPRETKWALGKAMLSAGDLAIRHGPWLLLAVRFARAYSTP